MDTKAYKVEEKKVIEIAPADFLKKLGIKYKGKITELRACMDTWKNDSPVVIHLTTETEDKLLQIDFTKTQDVAI